MGMGLPKFWRQVAFDDGPVTAVRNVGGACELNVHGRDSLKSIVCGFTAALLSVTGATVTTTGSNITAANLNVSAGSFDETAGTTTVTGTLTVSGTVSLAASGRTAGMVLVPALVGLTSRRRAGMLAR